MASLLVPWPLLQDLPLQASWLSLPPGLSQGLQPFPRKLQQGVLCLLQPCAVALDFADALGQAGA